jgi:hypothetical protein
MSVRGFRAMSTRISVRREEQRSSSIVGMKPRANPTSELAANDDALATYKLQRRCRPRATTHAGRPRPCRRSTPPPPIRRSPREGTDWRPPSLSGSHPLLAPTAPLPTARHGMICPRERLRSPLDSQRCGIVRAARAAPAQVAQLVEQRTENPRVGGSIPSLGTTPFLLPCRLPILQKLKIEN